VCEITICQGRAIAQAVSRRLPTAAARVQTLVWSCGILWWRKVALGQVFSENFGFPANLHSICFSTIIFTITRGWRIANSLTNQIIKKKYNLSTVPETNFAAERGLTQKHLNIRAHIAARTQCVSQDIRHWNRK
jgi:hypothetical protein